MISCSDILTTHRLLAAAIHHLSFQEPDSQNSLLVTTKDLMWSLCLVMADAEEDQNRCREIDLKSISIQNVPQCFLAIFPFLTQMLFIASLLHYPDCEQHCHKCEAKGNAIANNILYMLKTKKKHTLWIHDKNLGITRQQILINGTYRNQTLNMSDTEEKYIKVVNHQWHLTVMWLAGVWWVM